MEGFFQGRIRGFANFSMIGAYTGAGIAEESIMSLVTVLGSSISLVGLVFAFITYSLFSDLRNLSGTALMNLLAALFMNQLLYVIGVGGVQDPELCTGLAFSLQYMRTSVFCWLFLMTHHMFRTFRDNLHLIPPANANIRLTFIQYSVFGWCFPIAFLLISVFLQYKKTGNLFDIANLKGTNCWFVDHEAFLYGYGIPVLFLVLLIVYSLICTVFVSRQSAVFVQIDRKTRDKMKRKRKLQICLYVKLTVFISTVSLMALLYTTTRLKLFWMLFNIFQGVQGIFVALCVTCNCHVLKIYTKSLKKRRKHSQYGGIAREMSKSTSLQLLTWDPTLDAV